MKQNLFLLFFSLLSTVFILVSAEESSKTRLSNTLSWVRCAHPTKHDSWSCNTNLEWARQVAKRFGTGTDNRNTTDISRFFEKSSALQKQDKKAPYIFQGNQLLQDLEVISGAQNSCEHNLVRQLALGQTRYATVSASLLFSLPEYDVETLLKRQAVIKHLLHDADAYETCQDLFSTIQSVEGTTISLIDDKSLARSVKYTKKFVTPGIAVCNKSRWALLAREYYYRLKHWAYLGLSAWGLYNLTIFGARALKSWKAGKEVPTGWGMNKHERNRVHARSGNADLVWERVWHKFQKPWIHGPMALFAAYIGIYGIKKSVDEDTANFIQDDLLHRALRSLAVTLNTAQRLYDELSPHACWRALPDCQPLFTFFDQQVKEDAKLNELMKIVRKNTFDLQGGHRLHIGNIIRGYLLYEDCRDNLCDLFTAIGRIDTYIGLAQMFKECAGKDNCWCFAEYVTDKPTLQVTNMWNPFLSPDVAVANDIMLGGGFKTQHYLITGPNAAGKSTNLKAVALTALFAQTCGIVPAKKCVISPFHTIETYLNITDDLQKGNSLFKKEVMRAGELLKRVGNGNTAPALLVFDEMFNGTTPYEGMSAAYSVAAHLAQRPNVLSVIATHFSYLTLLPKKYDTIANMHVTVEPLRNGRWHRPYKLQAGTSDQHIALDMLREEGVESGIVDMAKTVLADVQKKIV